MIRVNIEGMMQPITKLRCSTILVSVFVLYPGHNFGHGDSDRIVGQRKQRTQHAGFTVRNRWKDWHLACESIARCTLHFLNISIYCMSSMYVFERVQWQAHQASGGDMIVLVPPCYSSSRSIGSFMFLHSWRALKYSLRPLDWTENPQLNL